MEIGLYTFGELAQLPGGGWSDERTRMRELIEEMELADQVGLDVFGIGEHHRPDFVVSAPAVVLAAGAERTTRIRLSSAVTVLSSEDPVRVYQQYATLDLLSGGRAEIMAGRGSFTESFPLFGYDLRDYDALFAEKLELLLTIREDATVHWKGGHRAAINGRGVHPRSVQQPLPVWIAIGGTPESAVRAGSLNLPLVLAIIGGQPERFAPFAELFRRAARAAGHDPAPPFAIGSHGSGGGHLAGRGGRRLPAHDGAHEPHRSRARLHAHGPRLVRRVARSCAAPTSSAARSRSPRRSCSSTRSSSTTGSCSR